MSRTVDERVVEMQFDNRNFERNVQTSLSTLDKLKQSLNFTGVSKGFENINTAANRVNMSGLSSGIETVRMKFSAMEVFAVNALTSIYRKAEMIGTRLVSALTIDPIKTGFQEYETQINAVQTILANTSSKGTTLEDVNKALDTLNQYADKTIYNFTQMTRNIGTFTAAGVDLDTSVKSIQGIANLAAISGSTSQQASTAMYQLSQALAAGRVSLMDWNSVVNAGMGGQVFQDALKRTAKAMGTDVDAIIAKYGSFRESLTQGEWLTTEVLTKTLEQFTMAAEEGSEEWENFKKSLMADGYTEQQAIDILKMANTATDAATKVKTFTQLWDTLKEAAQSGWTQTWEIIVGDFEEAKSLLTNISNVVGEMINKTAQARNELLQGWKDAGGRTDLLESFTNVFELLAEVVKPIGEAFKEIFPSLKVEQLTAFTTGLKNFTEKLTLSDETSDKIKRTFKGVFSIFDFGRKIVVSLAKAFGELATSSGIGKLGSFLLDIAATIGDFFTKINEGFDSNGLTGMLSSVVNGISDVLGVSVKHINSLTDLLSAVGDVIVNIAGKIGKGLYEMFGWIGDTFSVADIFAGLAGGGIALLAKKISGFLGDFNLIDVIRGVLGFGDGNENNGPKMLDQVKEILGGVKESLNAFATGLKISSLVSIAVAVGILSASLKTIAGLETGNVVKSIAAIGVMMTMLSVAFSSVTKTLSANGSAGIVKAGFSLILIASALKILANVMEKMSALSFQDICKGLVGMGGALAELCIGLKVVSKVKIPVSTSVAMLALAKSCSILGDALGKFGNMSWKEIKRGLKGMGGALVEFVAALAVMDKLTSFKTIFGSAALLIAVQGLGDMADGLKKFGDMSWKEIKRGLKAMGVALAELVAALGVTSKIAGYSSIFSAGAIVIVTKGLDEIADALKQIGEMSWKEIKRGLKGMGVALAEIAGVTGALGKFAGFSGLLGSGAILLAVQGLSKLAEAMHSFGSMSWEQIARGLVGMGGALAEVAIITGALGKLGGLSSLIGAGSLVLSVQSLGKLAEAFKVFGSMTWDEIKRGLVGMGGALAEIAIVTGALGALAGLQSLLGGGAILLTVQGLGDIADALKKFGAMSWDEIERGLTAMGLALGELAIGGLLNSLSIIGSYSISELAEPLGILADSVNKWKDVTVPEYLGSQLAELATGVKQFTLAGLGAGALSESAAAVGILAESVKKWKDAVVPDNIGKNMQSLAKAVNEFAWSGLGASTLANVAPAIGTLATGVKKWKDVTVPENIQADMTALAEGVNAFSFAFAGGWSISALVKPLGELPDSISKWNGVTVPENLEDDLTSLAGGINAFSFAFAGGWSLSAIVGPLGDLADSIKKWEGVTIPKDLGSGLKSVAKGVKAFSSFDISDVADGMNSLSKSVKNLSNIDLETLGSGLSTLSDNIDKAMTDIVTSIQTAQPKITSSLTSTLSSAVTIIKGYYGGFYNAGKRVVEGFAAGISVNTYLATAKARAMARAAADAAEDELDINSPSKVFMRIAYSIPEGAAKGIDKMAYLVSNSARDMAKSSINSAENAMRLVTDVFNSSVDSQPTIRPVVDLSDVRAGAGALSGMFTLSPSLGSLSNAQSINMMMNNQNGDNEDVVSAINKLGKQLKDVRGTTNYINGVSNGDESVTEAIETLVRAAKIGGRV